MDFLQRAQDQRLFNFTSEQMAAEHKYLAQFIITKALGKVIKQIETPATSVLLDDRKMAVVEQVQETCQQGLQALLDLDKKVFHVPPNVLLAQDLHLENTFTSEDEEQKTAQLEEMKIIFRENMAMLAQLKAEESKFAEMEDVLQKEIQMQEMAHEVCNSFNAGKISEFCNRIASDQPKATKI
ncbi:hypothetical protein KR059_000990 [Drosophila kikkawai]|nr:hypothetical protein KR059_000990 [Drosophila kikkawai]